MTISGTRFVVWAVCGRETPSGSRSCSALPWSAVTRQTPPSSVTRSTMRPRQRSVVSTARDDGRDHAGVADHVRVGEVDDAEAVAVSRSSAQNRSATSSADISGFRS